MEQDNYLGMSNEEMELQLWEYIDNISEANNRSAIEKLIADNLKWREKYHELLEVHQLMESAELEEPSMRFTKNVMEEIARYHIAPATKSYINNKIIYGIAGFFITVIVAFVIYGISQINWSTGANSSSPVGIDFTSVDYSAVFNNTFVNAFMMLNVVLGLMLLDRYLNSKKKTWRQAGI